MDDILFVGTKGNEKNDGIVCCHVNNEIYQISKMEFADKIENFSFWHAHIKRKHYMLQDGILRQIQISLMCIK